ncbi:hypothetical protein [Streptomyces sp. 7-21]|uniref:hypothetical protein n=1 Tax=Streptomyces sp. 7-21 TaxID=2802283 RepID=UPI00191EB7D6|nr:hypothetical protein [Streptomyces sp. 7-21]MBL1068137.1 hypothetical protein [Streptomyces sp. 7-21]
MTATTPTTPRAAVPGTRPAALYTGLALTVLATLAPLIDIATIDTLTSHVRDAYPDWGPDLVAKDRNAIATYLVATSALGIPLWLVTIRALTTGKRWARTAATLAFAAGTFTALLNLSLSGEHYDVIVPYQHGTLTLLPCLAGLAAIVPLWRRPTHTTNAHPTP